MRLINVINAGSRNFINSSLGSGLEKSVFENNGNCSI
jgi:hypothetical protein